MVVSGRACQAPRAGVLDGTSVMPGQMMRHIVFKARKGYVTARFSAARGTAKWTL